jgi:fluoride exporter
MKILLILLGGFLGAVSRYFVSKRFNQKLPIGTFMINMVGSFILGYLLYISVSKNLYAFLGIGFCGALTTFSTFKLETIQLLQDKRRVTSIIYLTISYIAGIFAAFLGYFAAAI